MQQVKPAAVQITSQQTQSGQPNDPFTVPTGVGSGVIYDDQGHIITNNHLIEGAESLLVSLLDGRSFPGKVVGTDGRGGEPRKLRRTASFAGRAGNWHQHAGGRQRRI
jgi:S1-C subfamily serine protease